MAHYWRLSACLVSVLALSAPLRAQQMEHFRMEKINDHVYAFIGSDPTLDWVDGNSYVILTDDGVFVVDSHQPPIVAEANIAQIRKLTSKPVKYLLNTHWHGDHNSGNFVYKREFPDVQIISHSKTREILARRMPAWMTEAVNGQYQEYIRDYEKMLADGKSPSGRAWNGVDSARALKVMALLRKYDSDVRRDTAVIPNVTFDSRMTLYMGGTEIQLRHECRANTPGDAYVWLPQDSILITGDIVVSPIPYPFGGFYDEWVTQLDTMLSLRPRIICPGHGDIESDTVYMRTVRDLFATIWDQGQAAYRAGVTTPDSLGKMIDLSRFKATMAAGDPVKELLFRGYIERYLPMRLLKLLKGDLGDDLDDN